MPRTARESITMIDITPEKISALRPARTDAGHKNTFGCALILAGSRYMPGALTLSVSAALRSGAGLVKGISTDEALDVLKVNCPCALTGKASIEEIEATRYTAAAIGPGLVPEEAQNEEMLACLIEKAPSLVIDAGALSIIANDKDRYKDLLKARKVPAVLTPHIGEFKRFEHEDLRGFSGAFGVITVLKDSSVKIQDKAGECYSIDMPNSGMAKGGSGDVLTGLITGFLAQGMAPLDAAVAGVWFHQRAGMFAAGEEGKRFMLPTDTINHLKDAFKEANW